MPSDGDSIRRYSRAGVVEPATLSSPPTFRLSWSLVTNLEAEDDCGDDNHAKDRQGGKSYYGGDCGGKVPRLNRFASVHRFSVCF